MLMSSVYYVHRYYVEMTSLLENDECQFADSTSKSIRPNNIAPGQLIDLKNWYLTLPTGKQKDPDCVFQPRLESFIHPKFFLVNEKKDAVIFRAHCGAVTTKNSRYGRSELRECTNEGKDKASWDTDKGEHTMTYTASVKELPVVKPSVIVGQIHATKKYLILIKLRKNKLQVQHNGKIIGTLDDNFKLNNIFHIKIEVKNNNIHIHYNDMTKAKVRVVAKASKCYFKVGSYLQSSAATGDKEDSIAEVWLYNLKVEHK